MRDDAPPRSPRRCCCRPTPRACSRWRRPRTRDELFWVDPQRRGILPLDGLHVSRRLARSFLRGGFEIRVDRDFAGVLAACADRPETWINAEIAPPLPRAAPPRPRAFRRDLARRRAGRRALRRGARRRLLRREHVQPPPRRLEVRADRAGRPAARRRLPPARHPVRDRPPGQPRRRRDRPRRLSPAAGGGGEPAGALPGAARDAARQSLLQLSTQTS